MLGEEMIKVGEQPFITPEKVITGRLFDHLMAELELAGIHIEIRSSP